MTNFLIDLGNTSCKVAFEQEGSLTRIFRSGKNEDIASFILSFTEKEEIDVIVFSNVRDEAPELEAELKKRCNRLIVLDCETKLPFGMRYGFTPTGLGGDRIAGAVGAVAMFPGQDIIKFDFGTALTIDFINKDGLMEGGNISLGLTTRFRALNTFTKRLPLIEPIENFPKIGIDTGSALTSGVVFGLIFEVDNYIKQNSERIALFTGGDSFYFAEKIKGAVFVAPNLVLVGLAQIAEYYAKSEK